MLSKTTTGISLAILLIMVLAAVFAPFLAPFAPAELAHAAYDPPGVGGLLGADGLGRDMLSRLLYAMRYTFAVPLLGTMLACICGVALAIIAALSKGWVDIAIGRTIDILMSIPSIIFALIILTIAGTSLTTLVLTMAFLQAPAYFRVTQPIAADLAAMEYVEVARLRGERPHWYLFKEILPNMIPSLLAQFGLGFSIATLFISTLSFLGIGVQPPAADLGAMVKENAIGISVGRLTALIPAFCIMLICLTSNTVVDWLVDHFQSNPDAK